MAEPSVCRLLPYAVTDGPSNMAVDEAMLESAAAGRALLRFYGWSEATLSLGYFQKEQIRLNDDRLAQLPWVRRPTGGATLVHHHELTYALALPPGQPWQGQEPWLCHMHRIITIALHRLGVNATGCPTAEKQAVPGTVLCFQQCSPGDVVIGTSKVVGSAQRKHRGALLQHGSILLASSNFTPQLKGVFEHTGHVPPDRDIQQMIVREFSEQTHWTVEQADWTDAERSRIAELTTDKYTQDSWNRKR